MYEIRVESHFAAAHRLAGYPGDCAAVHGHTWQVGVTVRADRLNDVGIAVDFREVRQRLAKCLAELDHRDLSVLPAFAECNPTSETVAEYLYRALTREPWPAGARVSSVDVSEAPGARAVYFPDT